MKHVRREDFLLKAHFAAAKILFFFRAQGFSYRVKMRHNRNNNKNNYLLRSLRTCFIGENVRTFPFHFDVYDEEHFFLLHYFYRNIEKRKSMIKTCCTSTRYHTILCKSTSRAIKILLYISCVCGGVIMALKWDY